MLLYAHAIAQEKAEIKRTFKLPIKATFFDWKETHVQAGQFLREGNNKRAIIKYVGMLGPVLALKKVSSLFSGII